MIAVVRISGKVKLRKDIIETFKRMGLKRKYSCVVFENPTKQQLGTIKKVKDLIAFREIKTETY